MSERKTERDAQVHEKSECLRLRARSSEFTVLRRRRGGTESVLGRERSPATVALCAFEELMIHYGTGSCICCVASRAGAQLQLRPEREGRVPWCLVHGEPRLAPRPGQAPGARQAVRAPGANRYGSLSDCLCYARVRVKRFLVNSSGGVTAP